MNCRHHHCRVLTVGEYVRIYDAAMGGPCPFVAGRWEHAPISRRCLKCGVQVALGPSDETPVAVEVRAAELADAWSAARETSDDVHENIGWLLGRDGVPEVPTTEGQFAGYLARIIHDHDEQGVISMTTAEQIRARLASMTDAEKAAALDRLRRAIFEPTDEEIAAEIDAVTDEEIDAELRADGVDVDAWVAEVRARVETACGDARGQALSDDGTTEGA